MSEERAAYAAYSGTMSERQLQEAIVEEARLLGWLVYHTFDSRRSEPGFPDLFLVHAGTGRFLALEVKTATGRVSEAQERWLNEMRTCGIPALVIRPVDRDEVSMLLRGA